jgi:hypothetical protein
MNAPGGLIAALRAHGVDFDETVSTLLQAFPVTDAQ